MSTEFADRFVPASLIGRISAAAVMAKLKVPPAIPGLEYERNSQGARVGKGSSGFLSCIARFSERVSKQASKRILAIFLR